MATMRLLIIPILAICLLSCGPNLQDVGIPTQGTVLSKSKLDRLKTDNYYITVGYFTQPDKENPSVATPKQDSPRTIDDILEDIGNIKVQIGDYMSQQITVSRSVYDSYNEGDYVDLLYEKGKPEHVVIKTK